MLYLELPLSKFWGIPKEYYIRPFSASNLYGGLHKRAMLQLETSNKIVQEGKFKNFIQSKQKSWKINL